MRQPTFLVAEYFFHQPEVDTMKPIAISIMTYVGSFFLAASGTYILIGNKSTEPHTGGPAIIVSNKSRLENYPSAIIDAVSAEDPEANSNRNRSPAGSTPAESVAQPEPATPVVEVTRFEQKTAKRTKQYDYRSWRVDIVNKSDANVKLYLEVEWLDAEGFRVAYDNESRLLAPGVNVVSDVHMFDSQESSRVHSFRVTKTTANETSDTSFGLSGFQDKITKRTDKYTYRAWRADVINNTNSDVRCYVEVEWLDADGHRVAYGNERRTLTPGVNVISDTQMLDNQDNARIKAFRVVKIQ